MSFVKHIVACMHEHFVLFQRWHYAVGQTVKMPSGQLQQCNAAMTSYLPCKEATHTDDAEDVEDSWSHDGPHTHVTFSDEHPWGEGEQAHTHTHTHTHTHRALGLRREHRWCFVHYMTFQLQPSICSIDKQMSNNCQNICKWLSHGFPSLSHTHRPTYTCKSAHGKERQEENVSEEA